MSAEQGSTAKAAGAGVPELVQALRELLAELSEGKRTAAEIEPAANLFEYGYVDSLSGVMFIAEIEERYGVRIDDLEFVENLTSVEAVARHLSERL